MAITLLNRLYEGGSERFQDAFVRFFAHAGAPPRDFIWQVRVGGYRVAVPVRRDDLRSWQFAQSYQWHDRALRRAEATLLELVSREDRLFDVGANLGLRSIYALAQGRPVVMFEPNVELRAFTEELLRRNGFRNWVLENLCLGSTSGRVTFYVSASSYLSSLDRQHAAHDGEIRACEVSIVTLDHYVGGAPRERSFSVIKIDVEGHELEVLRGANDSLARFRPVVLLEVRAANRDPVHAFLSQRGFIARAIVEGERSPLATLDCATLHKLPTWNFLYVPAEKADLLAALEREFAS